MSHTAVKAIQTRYAGCHFRSRLEARWAVFFDQLDIPWEYEPEGFETSAGPYLPDFRIRIPQTKSCGHQWFEVKPDGFAADPRHAALSDESGTPVLVAAGMARSYVDQLRGFASPLRCYGLQSEGPWPVAFCDSTNLAWIDNYCALGDDRHWCQEAMNHTLADERCHLALYGLHHSDPLHPHHPYDYMTFPPPAARNVDAAYAAARSERFGR